MFKTKMAIRLKAVCSKLSNSLTYWRLVKVDKLQTLKLLLSITTTLSINLDTYINQSLSFGKVGAL